ncbi:hypothetical protein OA803_24395, partial [Citrobacter portucalensis]
SFRSTERQTPITIVQANGADFAFPSQTLYMDNPETSPSTH